METEKFFSDQGQFSISQELVLLLDWLMTHKRDQIKNLIKKSFTQGFALHLLSENKEVIESDLLYYTVFDFFDTLESMLHEILAEETKRQAHENKLLHNINNFDTTILDKWTLQSSLEKIVKQMPPKQDKAAREQLMKEVLLRWKPIKNQSLVN